jgi:hypothetical protein
MLEKIKTAELYSHDLSDDYKMRWYTIQIRLQEKNYIGSIYYQYGTGAGGISPSNMDGVLEFIESLSCEEIEALNDECLLLNDIDLYADKNGEDIHFKLHNDVGETIDKCTTADELPRYITGYNIIFSEGCGKKKERRRCQSCSHFFPIDGTAKGQCEVKKEPVQRSRIICAFDYDARVN